ncbi:UNVERIFIED_CONTAM: hypothetical protein FKN15_032320 [Acipenser sinensis]
MRQGLALWSNCVLSGRTDNHSRMTAQAVAHTRQPDKERPTTQVRRLLKDRKAKKGSVFFKSLIPGKRQASFQHECKGNTIDSRSYFLSTLS